MTILWRWEVASGRVCLAFSCYETYRRLLAQVYDPFSTSGDLTMSWRQAFWPIDNFDENYFYVSFGK